MTQDALELQIQDYLDDRMGDVERRAFEERLAADAELAGRVGDFRAISEALEQDAPELPPGFHTRLRARFEAQQAPARRWFRPLSWETAGLVTAVAFAAVLFVPVLWEEQRGKPDSRVLFKPSDKKEMRQEASREAVEEDRNEAVGSEALEEDSDFAPSPESAPESASESVAEPKTVVEPEARIELERRDEPAKSRPAAPSEATLQKAEAPGRAKRSRSGDKGAAMGDVEDELRAQSEGLDDRSFASRGVALTAGIIAEGEILEIRSEEQWNRLVLEVGAYDPASRLVLVGTRNATPADCARSVIVTLPDAHEIRLTASTTAATASSHGCAFRLPADDLPVRVIGPTSAP